MRGIFIVSQSGNKVTGHYLSIRRGRWQVHRFKDCALDFVVEAAERVIENPQIYKLKAVGENK